MYTERNQYDAIDWLWQAGLRFASGIDAGCADGEFGLMLAENGPLRGASLLNIDAQDTYRPTLERIQAALGGHFRICALGEQDGGTVELQAGAHPYWSSLRPPGDAYWQNINDLRSPGATRKVPLRTLDALVEETGLPAPHLLKLDIQGAEAAALRGARRTLESTAAVLVEVMLEDFHGIHELLAAAGFQLFDLTEMHPTEEGPMGWFYPVYVHRRHAGLRPRSHWNAEGNASTVAMQAQRRDAVLSAIDDSLKRLRAGQWPADPAA